MKKRNLGVELFRIACMLAICMQHAVYFSNTGAKGFEGRFWNFGVVGFALITGYYGVSFKMARIVKLWVLAIVCACIVSLFGEAVVVPGGGEEVGLMDLVCTNWYLNGYTVLILLSPLLNAALDNLFVPENKERLRLAVIAVAMLVCWSWFQELWGIRAYVPKMAGMGRQSFMTLVYIYVVGRCLHNYGLPNCLVKYRTVIMLASFALIPLLGSYTSPVTILFTVFLFCFFEGIQVPKKYAGTINLIVPSLFAIYLLHTNSIGFHLINKECDCLIQAGFCRYIAYATVALTVFAVSIIVDMPRRCLYLLVGRYFDKCGA